jgi:uncharacterized membrane protein YiaA
VAAGTLLIGVAIGGYVLMHVFFFGVPHFTMATPMGKSEIGYALSILLLVGLGAHSISRELKERRAQRRPLTPAAAGTLLICVAIGGYVLMHVFFFGVPHFTMATPMGKSEIGYALSILALAGLGAHSISRGLKERRAQRL